MGWTAREVLGYVRGIELDWCRLGFACPAEPDADHDLTAVLERIDGALIGGATKFFPA
ncbi:hypothetical protein ACFYV7_10760 [Nocardia suismassiliense]|uniref:Uncharacterized protein n=1 Tax=Nocardia suismassiliense TaxID=2077092 RepID=A0ABW6QQP9_9NOCA